MLCSLEDRKRLEKLRAMAAIIDEEILSAPKDGGDGFSPGLESAEDLGVEIATGRLQELSPEDISRNTFSLDGEPVTLVGRQGEDVIAIKDDLSGEPETVRLTKDQVAELEPLDDTMREIVVDDLVGERGKEAVTKVTKERTKGEVKPVLEKDPEKAKTHVKNTADFLESKFRKDWDADVERLTGDSLLPERIRENAKDLGVDPDMLGNLRLRVIENSQFGDGSLTRNPKYQDALSTLKEWTARVIHGKFTAGGSPSLSMAEKKSMIDSLAPLLEDNVIFVAKPVQKDLKTELSRGKTVTREGSASIKGGEFLRTRKGASKGEGELTGMDLVPVLYMNPSATNRTFRKPGVARGAVEDVMKDLGIDAGAIESNPDFALLSNDLKGHLYGSVILPGVRGIDPPRNVKVNFGALDPSLAKSEDGAYRKYHLADIIPIEVPPEAKAKVAKEAVFELINQVAANFVRPALGVKSLDEIRGSMSGSHPFDPTASDVGKDVSSSPLDSFGSRKVAGQEELKIMGDRTEIVPEGEDYPYPTGRMGDMIEVDRDLYSSDRVSSPHMGIMGDSDSAVFGNEFLGRVAVKNTGFSLFEGGGRRTTTAELMAFIKGASTGYGNQGRQRDAIVFITPEGLGRMQDLSLLQREVLNAVDGMNKRKATGEKVTEILVDPFPEEVKERNARKKSWFENTPNEDKQGEKSTLDFILIPSDKPGRKVPPSRVVDWTAEFLGKPGEVKVSRPKVENEPVMGTVSLKAPESDEEGVHPYEEPYTSYLLSDDESVRKGSLDNLVNLAHEANRGTDGVMPAVIVSDVVSQRNIRNLPIELYRDSDRIKKALSPDRGVTVIANAEGKKAVLVESQVLDKRIRNYLETGNIDFLTRSERNTPPYLPTSFDAMRLYEINRAVLEDGGLAGSALDYAASKATAKTFGLELGKAWDNVMPAFPEGDPDFVSDQAAKLRRELDGWEQASSDNAEASEGIFTAGEAEKAFNEALDDFEVVKSDDFDTANRKLAGAVESFFSRRPRQVSPDNWDSFKRQVKLRALDRTFRDEWYRRYGPMETKEFLDKNLSSDPGELLKSTKRRVPTKGYISQGEATAKESSLYRADRDFFEALGMNEKERNEMTRNDELGSHTFGTLDETVDAKLFRPSEDFEFTADGRAKAGKTSKRKWAEEKLEEIMDAKRYSSFPGTKEQDISNLINGTLMIDGKTLHYLYPFEERTYPVIREGAVKEALTLARRWAYSDESYEGFLKENYISDLVRPLLDAVVKGEGTGKAGLEDVLSRIGVEAGKRGYVEGAGQAQDLNDAQLAQASEVRKATNAAISHYLPTLTGDLAKIFNSKFPVETTDGVNPVLSSYVNMMLPRKKVGFGASASHVKTVSDAIVNVAVKSRSSLADSQKALPFSGMDSRGKAKALTDLNRARNADILASSKLGKSPEAARRIAKTASFIDDLKSKDTSFSRSVLNYLRIKGLDMDPYLGESVTTKSHYRFTEPFGKKQAFGEGLTGAQMRDAEEMAALNRITNLDLPSDSYRLIEMTLPEVMKESPSQVAQWAKAQAMVYDATGNMRQGVLWSDILEAADPDFLAYWNERQGEMTARDIRDYLSMIDDAFTQLSEVRTVDPDVIKTVFSGAVAGTEGKSRLREMMGTYGIVPGNGIRFADRSDMNDLLIRNAYRKRTRTYEMTPEREKMFGTDFRKISRMFEDGKKDVKAREKEFKKSFGVDYSELVKVAEADQKFIEKTWNDASLSPKEKLAAVAKRLAGDKEIDLKGTLNWEDYAAALGGGNVDAALKDRALSGDETRGIVRNMIQRVPKERLSKQEVDTMDMALAPVLYKEEMGLGKVNSTDENRAAALFLSKLLPRLGSSSVKMTPDEFVKVAKGDFDLEPGSLEGVPDTAESLYRSRILGDNEREGAKTVKVSEVLEGKDSRYQFGPELRNAMEELEKIKWPKGKSPEGKSPEVKSPEVAYGIKDGQVRPSVDGIVIGGYLMAPEDAITLSRAVTKFKKSYNSYLRAESNAKAVLTMVEDVSRNSSNPKVVGMAVANNAKFLLNTDNTELINFVALEMNKGIEKAPATKATEAKLSDYWQKRLKAYQAGERGFLKDV